MWTVGLPPSRTTTRACPRTCSWRHRRHPRGPSAATPATVASRPDEPPRRRRGIRQGPLTSATRRPYGPRVLCVQAQSYGQSSSERGYGRRVLGAVSVVVAAQLASMRMASSSGEPAGLVKVMRVRPGSAGRSRTSKSRWSSPTTGWRTCLRPVRCRRTSCAAQRVRNAWALGAELADQVSQRPVVGVPPGFGAQLGDRVVGGAFPVDPEVAGAVVKEGEPGVVGGAADRVGCGVHR